MAGDNRQQLAQPIANSAVVTWSTGMEPSFTRISPDERTVIQIELHSQARQIADIVLIWN